MTHPQDPQQGDSRSLVTPEPSAVANPAPYIPPAGMWLDSPQDEEGINMLGLIHSLRRRWLPASLLGLLASLIVGTLLYILVPVTFEAISLVRVSQVSKDVFSNRKNNLSGLGYETYKETQETLIKSPLVLEAALRDPEILALETIKDEENQLAFLDEELRAQFQGKGEILRLSMRGKKKDDVVKIVDAVVDAYLEDIAATGRRENVERLEILRKAQKAHLDGIRDRSDKIHRLAEELGTQDSDYAKMNERIEMAKLHDLDEKKSRIESQYEELMMELGMIQARSQGLKISPHKFDIEMALGRNEKFQQLQAQLDFVDQQIIAMQGALRPGSPGFTRLQAERSAIEQEMQELRRTLTPQVTHHLKRELLGMDETRDEAEAFTRQTQAQFVAQRLKSLQEAYDTQLEHVKSLTGYSSELVLQKQELDSLTELADEITQEITKLEMELSSPNRITLVQPGIVPNQDSFWSKLMLIAVACIATFGMTVLGIAVWDFLSHRLNSGKDLEKSVGVPVIGSLPAIQPTGFSLGGRANREAAITDAIDSIRAAITYGDRGNATQSVVVTSAVGQEGKSTVASQLAVSLARGGRRTLLIDGDVRNPAQHGVFGVPADRGLCEVLRQQATIEDVVQTTPAENLWVLPAGRCDATSFRALTSDGLTGIMDRLSAQFDFVVIDSGPVLTGPEALIFGQFVDGAILTTRRDVSQLPKVDDAYRRLQSVGVHVIGSVVNGVESASRTGTLALTSAK